MQNEKMTAQEKHHLTSTVAKILYHTVKEDDY